jgi:hypothetical protein
MKRFIIIIVSVIFSNYLYAQELNGVTFGIGIGWSRLFKAPNDYFLTTDANHFLQIQELGKSSAVISSTVTIKFSKLKIEEQEDKDTKEKSHVLVSLSQPPISDQKLAKQQRQALTGATHKDATFFNRLALNVSLNLAELNSNNIAFNNSIDGGIGLGYYFNEFTQVGLFYDLIRIRQMRDKVVDDYLGKQIPNGNEFFNALDKEDNNLFYNKYFSGFSLKVIFSLGNKKS